jgi:sporulation protein YlmC with PRC-barrel domain
MRTTDLQGLSILTVVSCAAAAVGAAGATQPTTEHTGSVHAEIRDVSARINPVAGPGSAWRSASRDMAERYYHAYRLIGSSVLNLDGERIGKVDNLVLDDRGEIKQMLVALSDARESDGRAIAISPHRAEIVSTDGSKVTVIRVDLSREELVQAQLARIKSNARVPAQRGAGLPDLHRRYGPLY